MGMIQYFMSEDHMKHINLEGCTSIRFILIILHPSHVSCEHPIESQKKTNNFTYFV